MTSFASLETVAMQTYFILKELTLNVTFWKITFNFRSFQCSKTCGIGEQQRTVQCKQITKEGWILPDQGEVAACNAASRPIQRQACNHGDCSAEYHWKTDSWGEVRIVPIVIVIILLILRYKSKQKMMCMLCCFRALSAVMYFTISVFTTVWTG